jgi:hypothetical protein
MELSKMIIPSKTTWVDYPGVPDFSVQLAHLTRDELMKLREKALNKKLNRKTRQMEEEIDSDLFQSLYIGAVLKDWKGLRLKYLTKFIPIDIGAEDPESELEFTEANAETMMKNSSDFDNWITDVLEDVENFTKSSQN